MKKPLMLMQNLTGRLQAADARQPDRANLHQAEQLEHGQRAVAGDDGAHPAEPHRAAQGGSQQ